MGFPCEINYILKLSKHQGPDESLLEENKIYEFSKTGHRIYPIDAPIDLANEAWEIVARVAVRKFCVGEGITSGTFEVLSIYDEATRKAITKAVAEGERKKRRSP